MRRSLAVLLALVLVACMRTTTSAQLVSLQATTYREFFRVDVQNASGTWIDYRTAGGYDWLIGFSVGQNVDRPAFDIRVTFHRENRGAENLSLAPLRADSALNVDDAGAYAPALDSGRGIRIYCAVLEVGEPTSTDWVLLIEGDIDGVDSASEDVQVRARSAISAELVDRFIEDLTEYGSDAGIAIGTVMQSIVNDWTTTQPTLFNPDAPSFLITRTPYRGISVLEALQGLAALIGFYVREEWDNGTGAFRLTLAQPNRTVSLADHVFSDRDYFSVEQLDIHRDRVRNVIRVSYYDVNGAFQESETSDLTSIARYGRRFYEIPERQGSPIDTATEADALRDAALADLKDPTMDKQVGCRFFWPVQLGDYYTFEANGVHYDSDQDLAVTGFLHQVENGGGATTTLYLTGKPVAFGAFWTKRQRLKLPRPERLRAKPTVAVQVGQAGTTGSLDLAIDDPDLAVTTVEFAKKTDAGAYGALASTWDRSSGTPSSSTALTRGEDVTLAGKHSVSIRYVVTYDDGTGPKTLEGAHSFDSDLIAEVTNVTVAFNADGEAVVSATGDEDTANLYVTVGNGTAPSDPTAGVNNGTIAGRTGTVDTGVKITTGNEAFVRVVAADAGGTLGPVVQARQERRIGPFHKDTSTRQVTGVTVEIELEAIVIPANVLGSNGGVSLEAHLDFVGTAQFTVRLYVNNDALFIFSSNDATESYWRLSLFNNNATNAQQAVGFVVKSAGAGADQTYLIPLTTTAEDSTAAMELRITGQLDTAPGPSIDLLMTHAQLIGTN